MKISSPNRKNEEIKKSGIIEEKRSIFKNYKYPFRSSNNGSGEIVSQAQTKNDNKGDSSSIESPIDLSQGNRNAKNKTTVYHQED